MLEELFRKWFAREDTVPDDNVTATAYVIGAENEITMDKIVIALKHMKDGKTAGYVKVSPEILMRGGGMVTSLLYQLSHKCSNSRRLSSDRYKAIIVPLYKKKGSWQVCTNYRPINLLSVVGKLYAKIIIERVVKETENKIWDIQRGFLKE
ncbi:hypothetical protein EVAR_8447_1 [Eumeta japonica]|uniref:Reverse transcriptase domain-containing protein n=1 Tax=Eumeta variegata TaxID=151549 RepID=A0A4C1WEH6_EUMVA|nr:hypothetical protein EVAR_8447_1 [Eumeta japonica]